MPCHVQLDDDSTVQLQAVLRILPGKRIVARAMYQQKTVLVKLFCEARYVQNEIAGYELLQSAAVKTPPLLDSISTVHGGACFYEYLEDIKLFGEIWKNAVEIEKQQKLADLLILLDSMYGSNIIQRDLHLGNFAYAKDQLYALDPASIVSANKSDIVNNIALLVAQLPLADWSWAQIMINDRLQSHLSISTEQALSVQIKSVWRQRLDKFLDKIYRDCTYIKQVTLRSGALQSLLIRCVRETCSPTIQQWFANPQDKTSLVKYLKQGNSAEVFIVTIDGRDLAVKHFRNKDIWRVLRRMFKKSRASKSWYFAHMLLQANIAVPAPLAIIERKLGPLVIESWYISEYLEGDTLLNLWQSQPPTQELLAAMNKIFETMALLKISHGDFKASNLLMANGIIHVIDYDGMRTHANLKKLHMALAKDRQRFCRNWPEIPIDKLLPGQELK